MSTRLLPDSPVPGPALSWRHRAFVHEYLANGRNAVLAYQTIYECELGTAEQGGYRLLSMPVVRAMIDEMDAATSAQVQLETGITLARTVQEIAKIAFFDPRKLFDANGDPKAIEDLEEDTAAALAGVDVEMRPLVDSTVRKYKLASKLQALDQLMKHLGGYARNNSLDVNVTDKTDVPIAELARRAAFLFRVGGDALAANESGTQTPRQAAS